MPTRAHILVANALTALILGLAATPAHAFVSAIWGYVKRYQLGVDFATSRDNLQASYETDAAGVPADTACALDPADASKQRCTVFMASGSSSGFGVFLQQAFKRQGLFHFDYDIGFGARYLDGRLDTQQALRAAELGLPLRSLRFSLAALVVKPYITLGFTPKTWPELLLSVGPSAQLAVGKVAVNDEPKRVAVATSSDGLLGGFAELELVFVRFGDGAFSLFSQSDFSGGRRGTPFYPEDRDGVRDVRAEFSRTVGGLKLVLDWP